MASVHHKACVFGNPIEQSKSPIIHQMFAKQFDIPLEYTKRFAEVDDFVASATEFFTDTSCIGANVTMPFKLDALNWVDELSPQAKQAGAVNTIIRKGDRFVGDNTDGYGIVSDLLAHGASLKNSKILLIGAGGAAKGALPALVDAGIKHVTIYNRSTDKAEALTQLTNEYKQDIASVYDVNQHDFDLVINATSLSLQGQLPDLPLSVFTNKPAVYDMVYLSEPTVFLKQAKANGCIITVDGLGMLVHQAAQSFYLWFGKMPETNEIYQYLRSQVKK